MVCMIQIPSSLILLLTGAYLFHLCYGGALSIYEQIKYKRNVDDAGLYSSDDDVHILTVHNFKKEIYGNDRAFLLEFYSSWCGHCQNFAPTWKSLATDIKDWKDLIIVAGVDCANEDNVAICREFEIMEYPTIKYFHEHYKEGKGNLGLRVQFSSDVSPLKATLLNIINQEQHEGRGQHFPNMFPILNAEYPKDNLTLLIVQKPDQILAQELSMDLHKLKNVSLKFVLNTNKQFLDKFKLDLGTPEIPALYVLHKNGSPKYLETDSATRKSFHKAIVEYLKTENIFLPEQDINKGRWRDVKVPDMNEFMHKKEQEALVRKIKKMGDVVFQMDLETALRFSLKHEVAAVKEISGEKLDALIKYLNILVQFFPFGKFGHLFLIELRDFVSNRKYVSGEEIYKFVKGAEHEDRQVFSSPAHWLACQGSKPSHRGYPCGLWKLFHYLTVNAAEYSMGLKKTNYRVVLEAMHGYVKFFLGCSECSQHFQTMARKRGLFNVSSWRESVLWLWRAHNEVNKRLSGDQTEDPHYPKIQFPSKEHCPQCYNKDGSWEESEVFQYLFHVYVSLNVRYIGSDTRILHLGSNGTLNEAYEFGLVFRSFDAGLCFILYLACFFLIVTLILMFLRKRRYRKKMYRHDLLGKV